MVGACAINASGSNSKRMRHMTLNFIGAYHTPVECWWSQLLSPRHEGGSVHHAALLIDEFRRQVCVAIHGDLGVAVAENLGQRVQISTLHGEVTGKGVPRLVALLNTCIFSTFPDCVTAVTSSCRSAVYSLRDTINALRGGENEQCNDLIDVVLVFVLFGSGNRTDADRLRRRFNRARIVTRREPSGQCKAS